MTDHPVPADFWLKNSKPFLPRAARKAFDEIIRRQRELCANDANVLNIRLSQYFFELQRRSELILGSLSRERIIELDANREYRDGLRTKFRARIFRECEIRFGVANADRDLSSWRQKMAEFDESVLSMIIVKSAMIQSLESESDDPLSFL